MAEDAKPRTWLVNMRNPAIWALVALVLINVANYADRAVMSVLQEDMKADLHLSDFQLGLLAGPVFALLYGVMGIPIARLAERKSRKKIILAGLFIWSSFTAMCGLAQNFVQLAFLRMGVGAAEAAAPPAIHSLIADYFSRSARGRAMSFLALGIPLGIMFGGTVGGLVAGAFGWRIAIAAVGLPGVVLCFIAAKLVFEAKRSSDHAGADMTPIGFWPTVKILLSNRVYRVLLIAAILTGNAAHAISAFSISYFMRSHDLSVATAGGLLLTGKGLLGMAGTLVAGVLSDRLDRGVGHDYLIVPGFGCFMAIVFFGGAFYIEGVTIAILCFFAAAFFGNMVVSPAFAGVQNVVDARTRATAAALFMFCVTVPGSLGPVLVGIVSDMVASGGLGLSLAEYAAACPGGGSASATVAGALDLATCRAASNDGLRAGMTAGLSIYVAATAVYIWAVAEGRSVHRKQAAAKAAEQEQTDALAQGASGSV